MATLSFQREAIYSGSADASTLNSVPRGHTRSLKLMSNDPDSSVVSFGQAHLLVETRGLMEGLRDEYDVKNYKGPAHHGFYHEGNSRVEKIVAHGAHGVLLIASSLENRLFKLGPTNLHDCRFVELAEKIGSFPGVVLDESLDILMPKTPALVIQTGGSVLTRGFARLQELIYDN